jgi:hypothetical protein
MKSGSFQRSLLSRVAPAILLLTSLFLTSNPGAFAKAGTNAVTVSPDSLSFGNQAINSTSSAQSATLTNNQTIPLTITSLSLNLSDYSYTTTCPSTPQTLAAGASCKISISFTPTVTGSRTATLVVLTDSGVNPMVSLSGTGVLAALVSPSALVFGSEKVGTSTLAQTVTLTNNQSTALTISSVTSSLSDFLTSSTCPIRPRVLAAGASCTTTVTFKPTVTGTRTSTLTFVDSANNSPQVVSLIGTGATSNLLSITVSPSSASVGLGATQPFSAVGTYSDHSTQNLTSSSAWTSSAPAIATVSGGGLASTLAQGTTNISATSGTIAGGAQLTVTAPVLASIAITPANPSLSVGMRQQLTATGTYTDGSTQDLTGSVTWNSTAKSVATVSNTGMATGVSPGQSTIKASLSSITGTTQVTVVPTPNRSPPFKKLSLWSWQIIWARIALRKERRSSCSSARERGIISP